MAVGDQGLVSAVVGLAASEAAEAGQSEVSPGHLLIALSRLSENHESRNSPELAELKREFQALGIQPRAFRRRLRAVLARDGGKRAVARSIHRSATYKAAFAVAERWARSADEPLTPVRLLRGVFALLGDGILLGAQPREDGSDEIPTEL